MSTLNVNNVNEVGGAPVIASGVLDSGSLPTGTVLQVVSTTKTDTFTTTSGTYADVTGLSASITPSSTSSKILVTVNTNGSQQVGANAIYVRLTRDGTAIAVGDSAGSRSQGSISFFSSNADWALNGGMTYLDSPSSTSAITYNIQVRTNSGGGTVFINRGHNDTDSATIMRSASTITLMEIAG